MLAQAFQADALAAAERMRPPSDPDAPMTLSQIREVGLAIACMAEQQMASDNRVQTKDARLDCASIVVHDLDFSKRNVEMPTGISAIINEVCFIEGILPDHIVLQEDNEVALPP